MVICVVVCCCSMGYYVFFFVGLVCFGWSCLWVSAGVVVSFRWVCVWQFVVVGVLW